MDYSDNIVVFPGKRPAHFLRKAIGESVGRSFVPPRVFSIDTFVNHVHESLIGSSVRELDSLDAVVMLHELHLGSSERIGNRQFDEFDLFLPLGLRMFSEFEEITLACVPVDKAEAALSSVSLRGLHLLGSMYKRFYAEIEKLGYTTRAMRYVRVAESFEPSLLGKPSRIILAGFFALTEAERRLVQRLVDAEQAIVIFQQGRGLEQRLQGLHIHPETRTANETRPTIHYYSASDTHGEVFGLSAKLKEIVAAAGELDQRTVIVVPDPDSLPPVVHQALALVPNGQYNISLGYPHTRTPVFGFLKALMDLVSSMYEGRLCAPDYLKFVLHPYTKNILLDGRSDVTRVLFHTIEGLFLKRELSTFFALDELENHERLFDAPAAVASEGKTAARKLSEHLRSIHTNTIRAFLDVSTVGELAVKSIDVLSYIAERSTASRHPLFRSYAESLMESLDRVSRSMLSTKVFSDRTALFRVLRNCLVQGEVPFHGTPLQGLQVLGFLETRNLKFDRVFIVNTNDEILPGSTKRYSLIPNQTRMALGLPTYREHDQIAAYYFDLLLKGAKDVHLFFTENDQRKASRFVEELLWEEQQRRGEKNRESLINTISYEIDLAHSTPSPIAKTEEMVEEVKKMVFSATRLDTYLKCGLKFYYAYLLRLEEREEVLADVDRLGLGRFVHSVLCEYFAPFVGKQMTDKELDTGRLEDIIEKRFAEEFGHEEVGNKHLLKVQVKEQLKAYLEKYEVPRLRESPVTLLALEKRFEVDMNGWRFQGRIDRIEDRGGKISILDYKTGGDARRHRIRFDKLNPVDRSTWTEAIGSLQLPMYMLLYGGSNGGTTDNVDPAYLMLGKGQIDQKIEVPLFDRNGSQDQSNAAMIESVMFKLLDELTDLSQPFLPPHDLQEQCPNCPFTGLCGTQWVKNRGRNW